MKHYVEKPDTKGHVLYESIYVKCPGRDKTTETESRLAVRGSGRKEWDVATNGYRVSFGGDGNTLK